MQDLDLDELDQAVNNMMTKPRGKRAAKKPADTPAAPVASKPESVMVNRPVPKPEPTPAPAEKSEEPAPRPAEPVRVAVNRPVKVPERRRMHPGAMDIIQPTMPPKVNAPSGRSGRVAAALHPTQDVKPEPVRPVVPEFKPTPAPEPAPKQEPTPEPTRPLDTPQDVSDEVLASLSLLDEKKPDTNLFAPDKKPGNALLDEPEKPAEPTHKKIDDGWPDPLDFHDFGGHDAHTAAATEPQPEAPTPAPLAEEPKETPPSLGTEPVSVTDRHDDAATISSSPFVTTKVEKRPLGAFADAAHEPAKVALPDPTDAPVPHESTSKEQLAEASFESKQHLDTKNHDDFDPTDMRSMTIPPQYHTEDHKPADDVHHVFDTKEYHAAPQHMHTAHKSSPALAISIVVLIVLILAALLVGYFMMTGTFDVTALW